jgi:hypothetical protein
MSDLAMTKKRKVFDIVWHHTASISDHCAEQIDGWHKARGFKGIGYHYVVLKSGLIQIGRPVSKIPASVKNHNTGTIAVALCGNFSEEPMPNGLDPQAMAFAVLINRLHSLCNLNSLTGHRQLASTECPGSNMDLQVASRYVTAIGRNYLEYSAWYSSHVYKFSLQYPGYKYEGAVSEPD